MSNKSENTSKQQSSEQQDNLLKDVSSIDGANLSKAVQEVEGINGSTIEPVYSKRKMKAYTVTESELKQIGLANIGITGTASIGSAFFAFGLDIFKDITLATEIPKEAAVVVSYIQPASLFIGIAFWIFSLALVWWRRDILKTIKEESADH